MRILIAALMIAVMAGSATRPCRPCTNACTRYCIGRDGRSRSTCAGIGWSAGAADAGDDAQDPIALLAAKLVQAGVSADRLHVLSDEVDAEIGAAIEAARADALPDFDAAFHDVYTPIGNVAHG